MIEVVEENHEKSVEGRPTNCMASLSDTCMGDGSCMC